MLELKTITALLDAKFHGVHSDGLINIARTLQLVAKDEDDAKKLIENLKSEDITANVSEYRSGIDKQIRSAADQREANLRKQYKFVDPEDPSQKQTTPSKVEPTPTAQGGGLTKDDLAAAIAEATKTLKDEVESLKTSKITDARRSQLEAILTNAPDAYKELVLDNFSKTTFDNDEAFQQYLNTQKTNVDDFVKSAAVTSLFGTPHIPKGNIENVSQAVQDYVNGLNGNPTGTLQGKEI